MLIVGWLGRASWFFGDVWDYITRDGITLDTLLEPHNGHLTWPLVILYQSIYNLFGMDYFPWYFIPRLLGHAAVAFVMWRVMRLRGADPLLAFLVYVWMLFIHASAFLTAAGFGNWLVLIAAPFVALYIERAPDPTWRERAIIGSALAIAMTVQSNGIALVAAIVLSLILVRKIHAWWPALVIAVIPYAVWYSWRGGGERGTPALNLENLLDAPSVALEMWSIVPARLLAFPREFGVVLLAGIAILIAIGVERKRLGFVELALLLMSACYSLMVILVRIVTGQIPIGSHRYAYWMGMMAIPAVIPLIRSGRLLKVRHLAVGVAVLVLPGNILGLSTGLNFWEGKAGEVRAVVSGAAALISAGEPYINHATFDTQHATNLRLKDVASFVNDGWKPAIPSTERTGDEAIESVARGQLRMDLSRTNALRTGTTCLRVSSDEVREFHVGQRPTAYVVPTGRATITFRWYDQFGDGFLRSSLNEARKLDLVVSIEQAVLRLTHNDGAPLHICGLGKGSLIQESAR